MTTLRDLSYMIEANTEGLNKAFPALDKLVTSLERLANSVEALNTKFVRNTKVAGDAVTKMGDDVVRSTDKIKAALEKQQAYMISAAQRMDVLKKAYKDAGQSAFAIQGTVNAFQKLDKVSKDVNATTGEIAIARAKFNTSLQKSQQRLKELTDQQRALAEQEAKVKASTVGATKAQQAQEQAAAHAADQIAKGVEKVVRQQQLQEAMAARTSAKMVDAGQRQEAVLMGIQQKMNGLNTTVQKFGADNSIIDRNIAAFQELERVMRDANSTAGQQALARQKYNSVIEQSKLDLKAYIDAERQAQQAAKQTAAAQAAAANAMHQANAANAKNNEKQQATMDRNQGALIGARSKVTGVTSAVSKLGADPKLADAAVDAYQQLEGVLTDVTKTSAEVTKAKALFNSRLVEVVRSLKTYNEQTRAANQATKQTDSALLKQQNTLSRLTIQFENLSYSLEQMGAHPGRIQMLSNAFEELSTDLQSGVLDAQRLSEVVNKFNSTVAQVKRGEGFATLNDRMSDLASTAQVALGPLSGVASRITAITTLANRNTIAIAGLIGAFVGFTLSMARAVQLGAEFERQMAQINAILTVTGNQIGMSASEIESVVQRVSSSVKSTSSEIRDAAASLLTFRNVTKEVYEGALLAAQGLAIIARGDINSQIRNIGRTLDDPANNLTSLTESGVSFNAMEQEQIKLLQLSGNLHEAQAKVMQRVQTVIAAATGEVTGLTGAWKKLQQTFDSYLRTTGQGAALVQTFTEIINTLSERFKQLSNNAAATEGLITGMWAAAKLLAGTVELLAKYFDWLVGIAVAFTAVRIISFLLGLRKALKLYNDGLKVTAILQGVVTGGLKGLAIALAGIAGIQLFEWHLNNTDAAEGHAKSLLDLEKNLNRIKGSSAELTKFRELAVKAQTAINDAKVTGAKPPIRQDVLNMTIKMAEAGNIKQAQELLESYNLTVQKVVKGARVELQGALALAANAFVSLKNEHMPLIAAQQKLQAEMQNVSKNGKLMVESLIRSGKTAEEAAAMVELLTMQLEANGNTQQQYITNLRKQITAAQAELKITRAVGGQKRALQNDQDELNALYDSGIISTAEYQRELQLLATLGFSPLAEKAKALKKQLSDLEFAKQVAEMTKGLEDNVRLMSRQAELAGTSEYESAKAMAVLEQQIKMLNMGLDENHEAWQKSINLVKQLTDLEFASQHRESMRTMRDEAAMQEAIMDNMFLSERTRERGLALREKELQLIAKYGSLTHANAQAELALFSVLQQRQKEMEQWQDVADVITNAFQETEDALVEFAKTGEMAFDKLASSILEDIFRMTLRQTITDPLKDWLGGMINGVTGGGKGQLSPLGNFSYANPMPVYVTNMGGLGGTTGPGGMDPWSGMRKVGDKVGVGGTNLAGAVGSAQLPKIDSIPTKVTTKLADELRKQAADFKLAAPTIPVERAGLPDITGVSSSFDSDLRELSKATRSLDKTLAQQIADNADLVGKTYPPNMTPNLLGGSNTPFLGKTGRLPSAFDSGRFADPATKMITTGNAASPVAASFGPTNMPKPTGIFGAGGTPLDEITTSTGLTAKVNAAYSKQFQGFINDLEKTGYKIKSLGGYNYRNIAGTNKLSKHATGEAIDINPSDNPLTRKGMITDMPPETSALAKKWGLGWGAEWKSLKDPMHFEALKGGVGAEAMPKLPEIGPVPQFKELNATVAQTNSSMSQLGGGFEGLTGKVDKFSDFDLDLKKFAGGRQSTNIEDLRNMGTMDWLKNEASVTKNTFFPQAGGTANPASFGLPSIPENYNPAFSWEGMSFAGPTKDQFFKDIGWSTGGGMGMGGGMMGGATPFMGGGGMMMGGGMPAPGAMPFGGFTGNFGGDPTSALSGTVEKLNTSFTSLSDTIPQVSSSLTSGLNSATSAATQLADGGLSKAATGLSTFSDQALTSAITQQAQTTTQTTSMGLASAATSAQVTQLGAAASAASAQMATAGAASGAGGVIGSVFHGGGIVGSGGGTALMSGRGFATAPRLHGGLHPNEFRAVLKRGEGVFTEPQMEALGDAVDRNGNPTGGNPNGAHSGNGSSFGGPVNIILQGVKDYDSFRKSEAQFKAGAASIAQRAQQRQG